MYNGNDEGIDGGCSSDSRIDNNNQIQFEMNYGSTLNTPKYTQKHTNVKANPARQEKKIDKQITNLNTFSLCL